jgi:hypothetical protein
MINLLRIIIPYEKTKLFDNSTFYEAFTNDLITARKRIYIECPYITSYRLTKLKHYIDSSILNGVEIVVNTRNPEEHQGKYFGQAVEGIRKLQQSGVKIFYTVKLHRKIAIIDNNILWEGSLNILSHSNSSEIMRRTVSIKKVDQFLKFVSKS